jgi:hypothetical protein
MSARVRVRHETRAARKRRESLMRLGVWIFLILFAFTVAGGVVAFTLVSR